MSSLQKFHRRTNGGGVTVIDPDSQAPTYGGDGTGSATLGYWLGNVGSYKLRVAPKSTEIKTSWGSYGIVRGTTFVNNGPINTNTLYTFGSAAHPAAFYCKSLTTGGYTTWYLPAKNELNTIYSSKSKTPFATTDAVVNSAYWSSTEVNMNDAIGLSMSSGNFVNATKGYDAYNVRAVRRSTI